MREAVISGLERVRYFVTAGFDTVESAFKFAALLALLAMMVLVTGNALGRYLFNEPISGVYEVTELYLMPAVVFFTAAHLQEEGGNINVDLVYQKLPTQVQTGINLVGRIMAVVVFLPIGVWAGREFWDGYTQGATTVGVVSLPIYLSWLIMAIGLILLVLRLLVQLKSDLVTLYQFITGDTNGEVGA